MNKLWLEVLSVGVLGGPAGGSSSPECELVSGGDGCIWELGWRSVSMN